LHPVGLYGLILLKNPFRKLASTPSLEVVLSRVVLSRRSKCNRLPVKKKKLTVTILETSENHVRLDEHHQPESCCHQQKWRLQDSGPCSRWAKGG
jgi:hypothetical protein